MSTYYGKVVQEVKMKVQISIDDGLMERLDKAAKENYTSRSGYIAVAVSNALRSQEMANAIIGISYAIQKMAATGTVDAETKEKIDDFERLVKMIGPLK